MANGLIDVGILRPNLTADLMTAGQNQRNALIQQQQAQQLHDLQIQNALREQRLAGEEEAAGKAAGNDLGRLQTELFQRGLMKQGLAVGAQQVKQQADRMVMLKNANDLKRSATATVLANPTIENAIARTQEFGQQTGMDVTSDLKTLQDLAIKFEGDDLTKAVTQWAAGHAMEADKLLPKFQHFDQGSAVVTGSVNPLTGQFTQGTAFTKGMAPGEGARIGLEARRVALAEEAARRNRQGIEDQKPLTSAQEFKLRQDIGKDRKALGSIEANSNSIDTEIDRLLKHPGLGGITGYAGMLPTLPSSEAGGAKNILEGIQGKVKALGRDIASQSGKLGNMAVQEWKFVADAVAALDPRSPDFTEQLKNVQSAMVGLKGRTRQQFEDTYSPYIERFPELGEKRQVKPNLGKSVTRTGTLNGRKVVQYSDGSIDYAD